MQRDIVVKGRGLGGTSDLTLLAPIKPGFVESLESVTYKTRIKRVLETLHGARSATHEYAAARLLSDSVERVSAIHSVRVAVLEPENKVLLAVTFDGSWESYIRVLWDKVGSLLDLIFCGTEDYVTAYDHSFDEWLVWARRVQVETGFFYGPADSTARDVLYQRRIERMRERGVEKDLEEARLNEIRAVLPSAEEIIQRIVKPPQQPAPDDPPIVPTDYLRMFRERTRNGIQGLAGLYRLTDLHRPGTSDGEVLRHAAIDLLLEFVQLWISGLVDDDINEARDGAVPGSGDGRFRRQLDWLFPDRQPELSLRPRPTDAASQGDRVPDNVLCDIQGGIVRAYPKVTHGATLMLGLKSSAGGRDILAWLSTKLTNGAEDFESSPARPFCNVAFTPAGLRALGMSEDTLGLFPEEFRQGMSARAGLLGDVRNNHPRRWRLPRRVPDLSRSDAGSEAGFGEIELDSIHVVVQLRCDGGPGVPADLDLRDPLHPLHSVADRMLRDNPGVELLSVQALVRRASAGLPNGVEENFGYADGFGQPEVEAGSAPNHANRVHLGEIVCGHENAADFEPDPTDPALPDVVKARLSWLTNGSFLVVRKYRQFARRLEVAVSATAVEMAQAIDGDSAQYEKYIEVVYAKLMGRARDGIPVGQKTLTNSFNYKSDPEGRQCPLHAHVRLAHPRSDRKSAARLPRLMRRGMSYGPQHNKGTDDDADERGVLFMAYNASLSEQYEVIQRWLTGGNSTGASSGQSCPIVGVPENGYPRHFRFEHAGRHFSVQLEQATPLLEEPRVLTRLEWGMYLFAPSMGVVNKLHALATAAAAGAPAAVAPWELLRGKHLIAGLEEIRSQQGDQAALDAWKAIIEDPESIDRLDAAAVWAAIREEHGGVLKTPYGTLVASRELLMRVLLDPDASYSIRGQFERMQLSVGEIFLGMDAGKRYDDESIEVNRAIGVLTDTDAGKAQVFEIAFEAAKRKLDQIICQAREQSGRVCDPRFEVGFDAREVVDEVLADLCEAWFGIKGSEHFRRGGSDWAWKEGDPPLYPGHFTALSRYMFQPNPGPVSVELGQLYGRALSSAMVAFVDAHRAAGTTPKHKGRDAPLAFAIFNHSKYGTDPAWVARTMVGVLMGFIAPIIGAVLNVLREWQREGRFASIRTELAGRTSRTDAIGVVTRPMAEAARMRPMPQIVWRVATKAHRLGPPGKDAVEVAEGEKIVLGLVSGTQQSLADGLNDERLMFGGKRTTGQPHPTHACPGYLAGIEAMLGTLTAVLARPEKVRQGFAPLTFVAEGFAELPEHCRGPSPALLGRPATLAYHISLALEVFSRVRKPLPPRPKGREGLILAIGDSWLRNPYPFSTDLREELESFDYLVPKDLCDYEEWGYARTLGTRAADICDFIRDTIKSLSDGPSPKAVLLSGGGNDSTRGSFLKLLLENDHNVNTSPLDPDALLDHIAKLKTYYETVFDAIRLRLVEINVNIPVIVHGYDHPLLPDKAGLGYVWFREQFKNKHYDPLTDRPEEIKGLAELINAFNDMLSNLASDNRYKTFVRYVDLRGTLKEFWDANAVEAWKDDLHPENDGFFALATKIDAMVQAPFP